MKLALGKASRNPLYESILHDCYGAVFFGKLAKISTRRVV